MDLWLTGQARLVRQGLELLVLVLAYLAYYWIDIKLTIMILPTVIWNPALAQLSIAGLLIS